MTPDDELPKLLCCDCVDQINQFFRFKQSCLQSNEILRKYLIDLKDQQLNFPLIKYLEDSKFPQQIDEQKESVEITEATVDNIELEEKDITQKFKCLHCTEEFELENDLEIHLICHPEDSTNILCTICLKTFTNIRMLKRHVRIHMTNKPFACDMCNKKFTENSALTKHLRKHRGERRHLCTLCGKSFYEANVLSVHMRTHTG